MPGNIVLYNDLRHFFFLTILSVLKYESVAIKIIDCYISINYFKRR